MKYGLKYCISFSAYQCIDENIENIIAQKYEAYYVTSHIIIT